jgi:hypothetical protein
MFITSADIAELLPSTSSLAEVDDLLVSLEAELLDLNMVFEAPVESTRIYGDFSHYRERIIDLSFAKDINITLLDYEGNTIQSLAVNQDYTLTRHPTLSDYFVRLELFCGLHTYERLSITAKFGNYIDFSTENTPARMLKSIIKKWIIKQLGYAQSGYQTIVESWTGDSRYRIEQSANRSYYSSILEDPEFQKSLNYFRL